ncbi:transmembrane protein 268 isoform X4 [Vidua chalybeata]|uniref:transmembrane protein 268 isoform X4 n=1 Tax=Vidua chalybeata TaxID=81927 RepID=UPI0023A85031|nr:transmembrane protein 268 isoform X4 [Vidua chalybeata]
MAQESQTGGTEKNGSSLLYSKSDFKEGALQWVTEPPQGRVLLVLSMDNTCPTSSFDMDLCADKLQSLGVQVPMDLWRRLIQEGVLRPEVRRYLFYSSRGFQIAMAVVFYISLWTNLFSTLQLCSLGHSWGAGVLVTLVALALTVLVILVIDGHQRKLNVNTDVRLAAVNEIFIKHSIILGITDVLDGPHNILQLWFVHFSPELCLQALAAHITHLQGTQAMAQQLLVIFSACYVRLLVTGQLPQASPGGHLGHSSVPCLCQFIQSTVLHTHRSWGRGR